MTDAANPTAANPGAAQPAAQTDAAAPAQTAAQAQAQAAEQKPAAEPQKPAARKYVRPAQVAAEPAADAAKVAAKPASEAIGKGAITRMRSKLDAAEQRAAESDALREELGHYAKQELERAPEKARKYVLSRHKDNPRAQLAELRALRESGLLDDPKPSPVEQAAANTAPPKAPTPDSTDPDVTAAKQHELLESNPALKIAAHAFFSKNAAAITRGKQKLAAKN